MACFLMFSISPFEKTRACAYLRGRKSLMGLPDPFSPEATAALVAALSAIAAKPNTDRNSVLIFANSSGLSLKNCRAPSLP